MDFTDDEITTLGDGLARLINNYLMHTLEAEPEQDNGFLASNIHLPGMKLAIFVMGPELASFLTRLSLVIPFCEEFFDELAEKAAAHEIRHHVANMEKHARHRHSDPKKKREVN